MLLDGLPAAQMRAGLDESELFAKLKQVADAKKLRDKGFTQDELRRAGYSWDALKRAGFSAADLKRVGASADELTAVGFKRSELNTAGFDMTEAEDPPSTSTGAAPILAEPSPRSFGVRRGTSPRREQTRI